MIQLRVGDVFYRVFTVCDVTGALTAPSAITLTSNVNGTDSGSWLTSPPNAVTTGCYLATGTIPSYAPGTMINIRANVTVSGINSSASIETIQVAAEIAGVPLASDSIITVAAAATPTARATALQTAVTAASALGGLTATKRATVRIPPGTYDFGTGSPHGLVLNTEFVDLVGMGNTPRDTIITSAITTAGYGTLEHSSCNNRIENLTLALTGVSSTVFSNTQAAAYFPSGDTLQVASIALTGTAVSGYVVLAFENNQADNRTQIQVNWTSSFAQFIANINAAYQTACYGIRSTPVAATTAAATWASPTFTLTLSALVGQTVYCDTSHLLVSGGAAVTNAITYPVAGSRGQQSTVMRNVRMVGGGKHSAYISKYTGDIGYKTLSMRFGVGYAGYYEHCYAECGAFGWVAVVYGTFVDCVAGDYSFAHGGTVGGGNGNTNSNGGQASVTTDSNGTITAISATPVAAGSGYLPVSASFVVTLVDTVNKQGYGGQAVVTTNGGGNISAIAPIPYAAGTGYKASQSSLTVCLMGGAYVGEFAGTAIRCRATDASFGGGQSGAYGTTNLNGNNPSILSGYCEDCYDSPYLTDDTGGYAPVMDILSGGGFGGDGAIVAKGAVVLNCKTGSTGLGSNWASDVYGSMLNFTVLCGSSTSQNGPGMQSQIKLHGAKIVGGTYFQQNTSGTASQQSVFQLMDSNSIVADVNMFVSGSSGVPIIDNDSSVSVVAAGNRFNTTASVTGMSSLVTNMGVEGPSELSATRGWGGAALPFEHFTKSESVSLNDTHHEVSAMETMLTTAVSNLSTILSNLTTIQNVGVPATNLPFQHFTKAESISLNDSHRNILSMEQALTTILGDLTTVLSDLTAIQNVGVPATNLPFQHFTKAESISLNDTHREVTAMEAVLSSIAGNVAAIRAGVPATNLPSDYLTHKESLNLHDAAWYLTGTFDGQTFPQIMRGLLALMAGVSPSSGLTYTDPTGLTLRLGGTVDGSGNRHVVIDLGSTTPDT